MSYDAGIFWLGVAGAAGTVIAIVYTVGAMSAKIQIRLDMVDERMGRIESALGLVLPTPKARG